MIHKIAGRISSYAEKQYNKANIERGKPAVSVEVRIWKDVSNEVQNDYLLIPQEHTDSNESNQMTGYDPILSKVYLYVPKYGFAYLDFVDGIFLDMLIFNNDLFTYHSGSWIIPITESCNPENFDKFMTCLLGMIDLIILSP